MYHMGYYWINGLMHNTCEFLLFQWPTKYFVLVKICFLEILLLCKLYFLLFLGWGHDFDVKYFGKAINHTFMVLHSTIVT